MEIKINKEIRNYTEVMFFGLSLRQLVFAALACSVAVVLFFSLRGYLSTETVSWVCIFGAAPFAVMGFVKYHGMTAEKFIATWLKSELVMTRRLTFKPENIYYDALRLSIINHEKECKKRHD